MSSRTPDTAAGRIPGADGGFRLSVRTSMLSEFRNATGKLGAFELSHRFTTAGALRTTLTQTPGVRFDEAPASLWSTGQCRFTFKNRVFEITVPFEDVRIAPAEPGAIYRETEELLRSLLPNRAAHAPDFSGAKPSQTDARLRGRTAACAT